MGTYFNPSNEGFRKSAKDEIYIDKSGLLNILNRKLGAEKNCIAVSHARRFGKSQAAEMIDAYYSRGCNSKELFSELEISDSPDFEEHLNRYNVIHLDISTFTDEYTETLVKEIKRQVFNEFREKYPDINYDCTTASVIKQVYEKSAEVVNGKKVPVPFVIIIDEWDCVVRNYSDKPELVHEYLQFLHSIFKSKESKEFLALGYITGILPIKKIENESALNNFKEYTMIKSREFTPYFGFTEKETKDLCNKYGMNFDSVKAWYDGYSISGYDMYNPNSVYQAMTDHSLESYWKNTSAFATINRFVTMNFGGLKEDVVRMLSGEKVYVDTETFQNDLSEISSKDDALTALIHLGYLGYDCDESTAYIPNYEVANAFHSAMKKSSWSDVSKLYQACNDIINATIRCDAEKVAGYIETAHETYTSILKYNDENALSCVITMAYFTAPEHYNVIREFPSGKGFADIVMIPRLNSGNKPPMIIELKFDANADTAIKQIKEKRYTGNLRGYNDVLLVGINYNKESKKHECTIEKVNIE
ncbi:MAG: AAA family ATPase [Oscillospiraceae bacterium]|nr:AAA family ATPase [Oscillospiraceae bacterium]